MNIGPGPSISLLVELRLRREDLERSRAAVFSLAAYK
jgi:hypothetical protein